MAIRKLVDELFITDLKDWAASRRLFADGQIEVDMSSLVGGAPVRMTADDLLAGFRAGLHRGKVSHHLATNYRVEIEGDTAEVWAMGDLGQLPADLSSPCRRMAAHRLPLLFQAHAGQ